MQLTVREFWTPKKGNEAEEYEDAYAYRLPERRFAVADGATEAAFSDRWARSLVRRFTDAPPAPFPQAEEPLESWLKPIQQRWHRGINWDKLPWFAQEKTRAGAFATMIGMEFYERGADEEQDAGATADAGEAEQIDVTTNGAAANGTSWCAFAVGDSCLFQVRDDKLVEKFPVAEAGEFNTSPFLVSSNPTNNRRVWEHIKFFEGQAQAGDIFFLATDALSHWFLARYEAGEKPWEILLALRDNDEFTAFCDEWRGKLDEAGKRSRSAMRNDDVTLLVIEARTDDYVPDAAAERPRTVPPPAPVEEDENLALSATAEVGGATMETAAAQTQETATEPATAQPEQTAQPTGAGDAQTQAAPVAEAFFTGEETVVRVTAPFDPEATVIMPERASAEAEADDEATIVRPPATTTSGAAQSSEASPKDGEQAATSVDKGQEGK